MPRAPDAGIACHHLHKPRALCRPSATQLLACLRVIAATTPELQLIKKKKARPLAGPVNTENEEQALGTLRAALESILRPLDALPLLAQHAQQGEAATAAERAAQSQLDGLHLDHQLAQRAQQEQQAQQAQQAEGLPVEDAATAAGADGEPGAPGARNENGFDADWRMSRHFCKVYLEGQRAILRRSLRECDSLAQALAAAATEGSALP